MLRGVIIMTGTIEYYSNIDLKNNEIKNFVVDKLDTAPTAVLGRVYYDTTGKALKVCTDATTPVWDTLATGGNTEELDQRIDALESAVGDSEGGLVKDVTDLKTAVGDNTSGLVKDVADIKSSAYATSGIDGTKVAQIATNATNITTLQTTVGDATSGLVKGVADNAAAITAIQGAGYITKDVNDLTNYYTKSETYTKTDVDSAINAKVAGAYKVKGSKTAAEIAALTGQVQGDVWNVSVGGTIGTETVVAGDNVVWDGSAWDKLAGTINLTGYYTKTETDGLLANKVTKNSDITPGTFPKITFDAKGLVTGGATLTADDIPAIAESKVTNLESDLAAKLDDTQLVTSFQGTPDDTHIPSEKLVKGSLDGKVDKEAGKGLSTEDFTSALKTKLEGIDAGAQVNVIETVKVNGSALTVTDKAVDVTVPTNNNQLTNGAGYQTASDVSGAIDTALDGYYTKTELDAQFGETSLTFDGNGTASVSLANVWTAEVLTSTNKVVYCEITITSTTVTVNINGTAEGLKLRYIKKPVASA